MIEASIRIERGGFKLDAKLNGSGLIGITGGNGSGKTTFLHALAGVIETELGSIKVGGRDIKDLPINLRRTVYLNQDSYFGHLDVDKHITWGIRDQPDRNGHVDEVKSGLGIDFTGKVSRLSMGQRARVILATAIVSSPDLILIDEIFANISERDRVLEYVHNESKRNELDVIFVTQDRADLRYADSSFVMDRGILKPL